jgi:ABC-type uncharacterized transport system involved in gliding motility auxiliary subunit
MEAIKRNLNYIGLGLIFLALAAIRVWPYRKIIALILAVLGIAALAIYIYFNLSTLKQGFKRKSFLYSSNLFLVIVLVLAILVLANYIFSRYHQRFDFTEAKLHSLSDTSVTVLKALKNDINARCFFLEGTPTRSKMESLLKIYTYHTKKLKYEFIDPDKNPNLVKRYEISQDGTTIFESGDKENRITSTNEEDITNAIIKVTREKKKVIYFLEGHGEGSVEESDESSYSQAKDELGKLGYEVKKQTLALKDNFPGDCSLLVIPGPQKDLLPNELETIQNYIKEGGRVFFMVEPESSPGLVPFLKGYGFKLEDDLIVDTVSRLVGGDYFMPMVSEYLSHEITRKFRYATFFPFARSVDVEDTKPEGATVQVIAKTSPNSWSERQLSQKQVSFDKDKDKAGPVSLAAVATIKPKKEEPEPSGEAEETAEEKKSPAEPEKEARLAVFGDAGFATNRYFYFSANGNFFLNTVNWLTEEADLISIQPKTSSPRTIQLTPSQSKMIFFVAIIFLPLAVLITGISVWVRRRAL